MDLEHRGLRPTSATEHDPSPDADVEADDVYGLVSVLYHALQGASAARNYLRDARDAQNPELQRFFERCRSEEAARARDAKRLLSPLINEARTSPAEPTSAAFAPGDGADDADVSPSEERGKVGNWPAL